MRMVRAKFALHIRRCDDRHSARGDKMMNSGNWKKRAISIGHFATSGLLIAGLLVVASAARAESYQEARQEMVRIIEDHARHARDVLVGGKMSAGVLDAMRRVPRHEFVPSKLQRFAYADRPLPIGHGQTISQPFIVALMTDLARPEAGDVILEIGTGSGYQAAVLAEVGADVFTIEIIEPLAIAVRQRFDRLGLERVHSRRGDGYYGWPEFGPFDAILVTAASSHVPPPLVRQLKPGGRMIIPVGGGGYSFQHLLLIEKADDGEVRTRQVLPVRFVPLTGGH